MNISFKTRLTLGSLVIASLIFGSGALFFLTEFRASVRSTTEILLQNDSRIYIQSIGALSSEDLRDESGNNNGSNSGNDSTSALDPPAQGQLIAVLDPSKRVIFSTLPRAFQSELISFTLKPAQIFFTFSSSGQNYRVMKSQVKTWNGKWFVIAARNDTTAELITGKVTKSLLFGLLILILLSGIAAWVLASTVLSPVRRMHRRALELIEDPTSGLLPVGNQGDELSELAVTLNRLIVEFRSAIEREQRMVSDASHELRTPMAQLLAQLELSKLNAGKPEELLSDIQAASKSAGRVSALASDLLFLSHKQADPRPGVTTRESIAEEVSQAIDHARILSPAKELEIDFDVTCTSGAQVSTQDFRRVLDNLLGNAVANCPNEAKILLEVIDEESFVALHVRDSGPGFPHNFIPIAFDRFSRPDPSRHVTTGGSGLGLAIVKAIAESSGGHAVAENIQPHGAHIAVFFPRKI
ncbi:MAG: HAMP domain-containing sensor histidine kinase [Candidatus Nanopelagicaceae bacterium]|nr:HAMP domain-containing sensor histidine kinase [Candidatus Nanopelagicaceae bacterium]